MSEAIDPRAPIQAVWGRETVWCCPYCAWDTTVGEVAAREHIAGRHPDIVFPADLPGSVGPAAPASPVAFDALHEGYRRLAAIVAETKKGRDRLVKAGFATVDDDGEIALTFGAGETTATNDPPAPGEDVPDANEDAAGGVGAAADETTGDTEKGE